MSLRWRVALGLGLITLLVIGFVGAGAYLAVADRLEGSVDDSLEQRAAEVTQAGSATRSEPRFDSDDDDDDDYGFTRPVN